MTAIRGIKIEDYKAWLDNPLTKALKQSHTHQIEQRDALLRQALEALEDLDGIDTQEAVVIDVGDIITAIRQHLENKS